MSSISVRNVNEAWVEAIDLMNTGGVLTNTRNGPAMVLPSPVTILYHNPVERVLFDPVRDANPIFHFHEGLWMLAGRDDATWLDRFVANFSARFSEDGGRMHGAYGKRWRDWFLDKIMFGSTREETHGEYFPKLDQLNAAVRLLKADPESRQVVIGMWDPFADLGVPGLKDRPCNTHIYLRSDRIVPAGVITRDGARTTEDRRKLDLTVCCRSNDLVYGCMGANVVHFSMLQEYLAARIGVDVGWYVQFANNLHMYESSRSAVDGDVAEDSWRSYGTRVGYPGAQPLVDSAEAFDEELRVYMTDPEADSKFVRMSNRIFWSTAHPMYMANVYRKEKKWAKAIAAAKKISAPDWRQATVAWLERRASK